MSNDPSGQRQAPIWNVNPQGNFQPGDQQPEGRKPPQAHIITPEERRVIQECNTEAFWNRSLPLGLIMGGSVLVGCRTGRITPSEKYGPWPKTILAATIAYFVGKGSYMNTCREKFLQKLPHSPISQSIRREKGLPEIELQDSPQVLPGAGQPDDKDPNNSSYFATPDNQQLPDSGAEDQQKDSMSYDVLRDQYRQRERQKYQVQQQPPSPFGTTSRPSLSPPSQFENDRSFNQKPPDSPQYSDNNTPAEVPKVKRMGSRTNKYGDEGFE